MEGWSRGLFPALIIGLLLGAGAALGGYFIGNGFYEARSERYVTVKGLAERDVRADLALWKISYTASGADLNTANADAERQQTTITAFVKARGFGADEIEAQPTIVTDTFANQFQSGPRNPGERFIIKGALLIRSPKVDRVKDASQATGELVKQGVVLGENYPQAPQYFFTRLNDIRPSMLADSTRSARAVAEQFAADSHSRLGPIRRANQGIFEITNRDASSAADGGPPDDSSSIDKKVRLVSTVDYYLIQ